MSERKPISKKLRFEVFKRDSFKCQYCGQEAPKVVLNCDHIHPVAEGGDNHITNLITSCFDCNSGKGARTLADDSVVNLQKAQLDELNERRVQIEMISDWRKSILDMDLKTVEALNDYWRGLTGFGVTTGSKKQIQNWVSKYALKDIYTAMEASCKSYLKFSGDEVTDKSFDKAFKYVPKVIEFQKRNAGKPYMRDILYISGILKNRGLAFKREEFIFLAEQYYEAGGDLAKLKREAQAISDYEEMDVFINYFIYYYGEDSDGEN